MAAKNKISKFQGIGVLKLAVTDQRESMARDIELLFELGAFRHLDRVWKQFLNPDVANCAEHSFRVSWVALTLARYEKEQMLRKF